MQEVLATLQGKTINVRHFECERDTIKLVKWVIKMQKIKQMDEALANKIAAGEVVENMASVVKELLENAIDAGSSAIEITLKNAGFKTIRVVDNGEGIAAEELPLALKRHATSKIRTEHDLFHIGSLGFRGEALPSIASVSRLSIESSVDGDTGRVMTFEHGEMVFDGASKARKGTVVNVENLFYNTPARLKHLKSEKRELATIVDYVNKIALSHADIRFTLIHDGKTLLSTTGDGDKKKILAQLYGVDVVKALIPFVHKNRYFSLDGFVSKPTVTRAERRHIHVLVNGRIIRSNYIIKAVLDGYKNMLPMRKYPVVLLKITCDPLLIDVNIHPQKLDIKFTEASSLYQLITEAIRNTLRKESLIPEVEPKQRHKSSSIQERLDFNAASSHAMASTSANDQEEQSNETALGVPKTYQKINQRLPDFDYIGQLFATYLLLQSDDAFYMLDQHAAAERIRYENYIKIMGKDAFKTQKLLVPRVLPYARGEQTALASIESELNHFGIKLVMHSDHVDIIEVPDYFEEQMIEAYTETVIEKLLKEEQPQKADLLDALATDLACKHSIRAHHYLRKEEVDKLLADLGKTEDPFHCPHGRPTIIKYSKTTLEKMFERIQS